LKNLQKTTVHIKVYHHFGAFAMQFYIIFIRF